jgi:hypothetical protein
MEIVIHRIDEWIRESMMLGKQKISLWLYEILGIHASGCLNRRGTFFSVGNYHDGVDSDLTTTA